MAIYEKLMGNPFVDAGICGICEWLGGNVQPEQITKADLEEVVNDVVPMMQIDAGWNNLYGIFPNSVLTNSAHRKKDQVALFKDQCRSYMETICDLQEAGDCMGCGRRDANTSLSRTNIPLSGWEYCNYFPLFSEGAPYCAACVLAIQMSPLVYMTTAGKFLTLHSNSWKALKNWARVCVEDVRNQQLQQDIIGCYNPGYKNPRNGIFYMARKMAAYREMRPDENISMQVYC